MLLTLGAFGTVRLCMHHDSRTTRAVKMVKFESLDFEEQTSLAHEIVIHAALEHPNTVKLYEHFQDRQRHYIVMELCQGKELFQGRAFKEHGYLEC